MATIFSSEDRGKRFIPEIWTSAIFEAIDAALVLGSDLVVNRDYEGEIRYAGDTVRIPTLMDPSTQDYDPTTGFTGDPAEPTTGSLTFEIEVAKAFRMRVEDITRVQSQIGGMLLDKATQRAGRKLAEAADAYIAGKIVAASEDQETAKEIQLEGATVVSDLYKAIVDLKVTLDKTNTPADGRFLVVSPDLHGLLLQDNRFIDASAYSSSEPIRNGVVGRILGFTVATCNVMPENYHAVAGHQIATTFAEQIIEVEHYRPEKYFADAVRGLHVYGAKVLRPEHLATLKVAGSGEENEDGGEGGSGSGQE